MKIRREHGLDEILNEIPKENSRFKKMLGLIRRLLGRIRICLFPKEPREIVKIRRLIQKSHYKGFIFHQQEVRNGSKLLEWVPRENYLGENGKLPE